MMPRYLPIVVALLLVACAPSSTSEGTRTDDETSDAAPDAPFCGCQFAPQRYGDLASWCTPLPSCPSSARCTTVQSGFDLYDCVLSDAGDD